jgi:hypothetical protein
VSLRKEIHDGITWKLSQHPALQDAFCEGGMREGTVHGTVRTGQEVFDLHAIYLEALKEAVLRLADEIDALKAAGN